MSKELKFKLTAESKINAFGIKLFRIEATVDFKDIKKGDKGGWLEAETVKNGDARVSGNAWVFGDAEVFGDARVYGNAWVFGDAEVSGDARVYGNALSVKADLWELLLHAIPEIPALRQAIIDGKVDGSVYEGECACLCGTIANVRKCDYKQLEGIRPNSSRPAEAYFTGISKGNTPENNKIAAQVLVWIDELLALLKQN